MDNMGRQIYLLIITAVILYSSNIPSASCAEQYPEVDSSDILQRVRRSVQAKLGGKRLKIVTIVHEPYTMSAVPNVTTPVEQKDYTGYVPDLISLLSKHLQFEYEFYLSPDGRYGYKNSDGEWTGLVGEVIKWEKTGGSDGADIAAAPLTVASYRETDINFLKPFKGVGYEIIVKRVRWDYDSGKAGLTFSMFNAFDAATWGVVIITSVLVAVVLWGIHRMEAVWTVPEEDNFGLIGSLYFVFTSLQWQGYDKIPRPVGARFLSLIWFAFVTILIATFIGATMNHFDWASKPYSRRSGDAPFQDIKGLVQSKEWDYGAVNRRSVYWYFRRNNTDMADTVLQYWDSEEGKKQLTSSTEEGLQKVRESDHYAFLTDTMTAKLHTNKRPCDLVTMGDMFGKHSYGFAIAHGHPLEEELNLGIVHMIESGDLEALEEKWWIGKGECYRNRSRRTSKSWFDIPPKQVTFTMLWGPLVLLGVGVVVSLIFATIEVILYKFRGVSISGAYQDEKKILE